ncbi:hypothetical protein [Agaribacter flavus]|uniref:Uncharacterized protein n=1 Tax=Agaribacter flavus TaxID=1902781 RepID=A0ABV7FTD5_9ALTE
MPNTGRKFIDLPELDLVIVVTGHEHPNSTQQLTAERILPAFIGGYHE